MQAGDVAPDFDALDQNGESVTLGALVKDGPIVLFFYPRAMTTGCTAETCHFRDLRGEFAAVGATAVGISDDPPDKQREFDRINNLELTLLSDPDRSVARSFGTKRPGPLMNKRATFVIDTDRTVLEVIRSEINMTTHADRALEVLRARRA